ncbi:MAG: DNA photolyase family protein [Burkholderiaceae bacterium]|jgi:deoxyribodipyrimidine photo-lyase|nr:DNA photolyase family protein [Burkholderiaceae bacterium]
MAPILLAVDKIYTRALVWFRYDLRVHDNAALARALRECREVVCVFIFERTPPADGVHGSDGVDAPQTDRRLEFQRESLLQLDAQLRALGGGLMVRHAIAAQEIPALARALAVQAVYVNREGDPRVHEASQRLFGRLAADGVLLHTCKDRVIFEHDEVLTSEGAGFTAFAAYRRAWLARLAQNPTALAAHPVEREAAALTPPPPGFDQPPPALAELGLQPSNLCDLPLPPGVQGGAAMFGNFLARIDRYLAMRDHPALRGPSYLSVHLRWGTLSVRQLVRAVHPLALQGHAGAKAWLGELIRREFFFQLPAHHPQLAQGKSFHSAFDRIIWHHGKHADALYAAWCEGRTGYPLVDAAMAQLRVSGYMHPRLRNLAASFLCKCLGLDWRRGEAYFAQTLNDAEFALNNGNWQRIASCGCDAPPWWRSPDPVEQSRRIDPEGKFICRYLPQLARLSAEAIHAPWQATPAVLEAAGIRIGADYPAPIVNHISEAQRTLARYAIVKNAVEHGTSRGKRGRKRGSGV